MIRHRIERDNERAADGPQRVFDNLLPRNARRDPWGGSLVLTMGELPSGYYARRDRPEPDGKGYRDNPDDERSGGYVGVVERDLR